MPHLITLGNTLGHIDKVEQCWDWHWRCQRGIKKMLRKAKVAIGRQSTCWAMLNEYELEWPNIHDDTSSILDEVKPIQVTRLSVGIMVGSFFKPMHKRISHLPTPFTKLPTYHIHLPTYTLAIYLPTSINIVLGLPFPLLWGVEVLIAQLSFIRGRGVKVIRTLEE